MAAAAPFVVDSGAEGQLVELPALQTLCGEPGRGGAGWTYVHGQALAPDAPGAERKLWSDVALVERFHAAVARINPHLPMEAVRRVCDLALTSTSPAVVEDHRSFHELLLAGVPVGYLDEHGEERHDHARLVDFDEVGNNEFLAVNQFTIIVGAKNRRPDILLYVNGLPLGQIECKAPGITDPAGQAVNQIAHYTQTIPQLYRYIEVVGVTDLMRAVVGTVTTPAEHFAEWKTMNSETPSGLAHSSS
jgi:type I restriction enzyme R subunit